MSFVDRLAPSPRPFGILQRPQLPPSSFGSSIVVNYSVRKISICRSPTSRWKRPLAAFRGFHLLFPFPPKHLPPCPTPLTTKFLSPPRCLLSLHLVLGTPPGIQVAWPFSLSAPLGSYPAKFVWTPASTPLRPVPLVVKRYPLNCNSRASVQLSF